MAYVDESSKLYVGREFTNRSEFLAWWKAQKFGTLPYTRIGYHHTYRPDNTQWPGISKLKWMYDYYYGLGWRPWGKGPHLWLLRRPDGTERIYVGTHPAHDGYGIATANHRVMHIECIRDGDAHPLSAAEEDFHSWVLWVTATQRTGVGDVPLVMVKVPGYSPAGVLPHRWENPNYTWGAWPKTCPWRQVSDAQIQRVLTKAKALADPPAPAPVAGPKLLGPHTVSQAQAEKYLLSKPNGEYSDAEVRWITSLYYSACDLARMDAGIAVAQMAHETGDPATGGVIASYWAARPRCNPAGIGVTGEPGAGVSFQDWRHSVVAHVGRLLAYARKDADLDATQRMLVDRALAYRGLPLSYRGIAPTIDKLTGTWAADREYHHGVLRHYAAMRGA